jgi:hypothetical protein
MINCRLCGSRRSRAAARQRWLKQSQGNKRPQTPLPIVADTDTNSNPTPPGRDSTAQTM